MAGIPEGAIFPGMRPFSVQGHDPAKYVPALTLGQKVALAVDWYHGHGMIEELEAALGAMQGRRPRF